MKYQSPGHYKPEQEQRWAVRLEGPSVELIPVTDRETAEYRCQLINDRYQAGCLGGELIAPVRAKVVPSPFEETEHWKLCAKVQGDWIKEMKVELYDLVATAMPPAYLIPSTKVMEEAWAGVEGQADSPLPPAVREYTMRLISRLPLLRKKQAPAMPSHSDVVDMIDPGF